jgi:hypothetical protein
MASGSSLQGSNGGDAAGDGSGAVGGSSSPQIAWRISAGVALIGRFGGVTWARRWCCERLVCGRTGSSAPEVPVVEVPVRGVPVVEVPVRGVPVVEVPLRGVPVRGVPVNGVPLRRVPVVGVLVRGVPVVDGVVGGASWWVGGL